MPQNLHRDDALLVVDVQNDFCLGGALPVPEGDKVVAVLNRWIEQAERIGATIVLTRDWHPPDHCSFTDQGGPWPAHCVQGTPGAAHHPDLRVPHRAIYVDKATDPDRDTYSAFDDTGLAQRLRLAGVERLWVGGLALDYCVKATVLDGLTHGFEVHLIVPATRAVNLNPHDGDKAIHDMEQAGAKIEGTLP